MKLLKVRQLKLHIYDYYYLPNFNNYEITKSTPTKITHLKLYELKLNKFQNIKI